ncbi:MAG: HAD-IA family hydrolase [Candidatus Caenarcaniphilales bacterium]|nr:HAD-IA family hydrolase [Candidatus Caenarcaniphilales bacterium]
MNPKLISFDAADTLIKLAQSIEDHYVSVAQSYGVIADSEIINKNFRSVFASTPALGADGQKGLDWWSKVIELTFLESGFKKEDFSDFERFVEHLYEALAEDHAWVTFSDVLPCLEALKQKNKRMIVFSNFDERLIKILEDLGIAKYFEQIICSTQIGYAKPDPKAFLRVAELVQLKPEEILHIGDSYENDYLGSQRAGMQSILLDRKNVEIDRNSVVNVKSLIKVPALIVL